MIQVHIQFFSTIRARIGTKNVTLELPTGSRVKDLKREIAARYPQAASTIPGMNTAVDQVFSDDSTLLPDGAEVAFFPHVTGG